MNNSFDDKIREALENFEAPYDAGAWAAFEKQLPTNPAPASNAGSSNLGWKLAAVVTVAVVTVATVLYLNKDNDQITQSEQVEVNTPTAGHQESETQQKVTEQETDEVALNSEKSDVNTTTQKRIEGNESNQEVSDVDEEIIRISEVAPTETTAEVVHKSEKAESETIVMKPVVADQNPITVDFFASAVTACVNQDVSFINESSKDAKALTWDFGDGSTSSEKDPIHSYAVAGTYSVVLRSEGKSGSVEKTLDIKVNPAPAPIFSAERKLAGYEAIPLYIFSTATQVGERAYWSFSDGSKISGNTATHLFRDAGEHVAKLTVTNNFGCSTSVDQKFSTGKFKLLAPEAFTPNGDGINETFIPKALPEMGVPFEMTIQNPKTGQVVFRTEDASYAWNGTLNNSGIELENGIYVWTVVLQENVVKNRVFTETIQLTR
ncbi:MAG: PKD domain-containing protein [Flavobacteriales bacterium]|nr:PKD domain-containing protein [Flavobacteriales bacterium]